MLKSFFLNDKVFTLIWHFAAAGLCNWAAAACYCQARRNSAGKNEEVGCKIAATMLGRVSREGVIGANILVPS